MRKRYQLLIKGNVQRVGFRHRACLQAKSLQLAGKALYIDDAVLLEAEGELGPLSEFIEWCRSGPEGCRITFFSSVEIALHDEEDFTVVPGVVAHDEMELALANAYRA